MQVKTYEELFGKKLTIGDIVDKFDENTKTGEVVAFGGCLNVRPPYQREFVYGPDKSAAVIKTIMDGYPLNVMYWAKIGDNQYELMDGQQRTISFCKYSQDEFSIAIENAGKKSPKTFSGLTQADRQAFLDYPVTVYICQGNDKEKLDWFQIINIAGIKLTDQEMRNAIYTSKWTTDAKRYFSRIDGEGYASEGHVSNGHTYGDYIKVVGGKTSEKTDAVIRQKLLEIVLIWATDAYNRKFGTKITIEDYMESHTNDENAKELWRYYEDVMEWVKETFPTYRDVMKGVDWGILYNKYHTITQKNADCLANMIFETMSDEISNTNGVYEAVLSRNIKHIHARVFDKKDMDWKYKQQGGTCPYCKRNFDRKDMHGDHMKPWSKGGKTEKENLQMLCVECNIKKSAYDTQFNPWDNKDYSPFDIEQWDNNCK